MWVITWMLDVPQGRILAGALLSLWRSLPEANASDAPTLAGGILGLLNGLISPDSGWRQASLPPQALLGAMKRFLDARLSSLRGAVAQAGL
jgi:hypothetical protein